jgi:hypothetical protein
MRVREAKGEPMREWRAGIAVASAVAVGMGLVVPGSAQFLPNLAPNPGFEEPLASSYRPHGSCDFAHAADAAHDGARSVKIVSTQPRGTLCRWLSVLSTIPVTPGPFSVGAFVKTEDVTQGAAQLAVTFWDASGAYIPGSAHDVGPGLDGTHDWTAVGGQVTAPAGAAFLRLELRLFGPGTAWFDDLILQRVIRQIFNVTPPALSMSGITGLPIVGNTLTASFGTWTDAPDAFLFTFLRCDGDGLRCVPIPGAGGVVPGSGSLEYVLEDADLDHRIRVSVHASNADDAGATATSAPTAIIESNCIFFADVCNGARNATFEEDPSDYYSTHGTAAFSWASDVSLSPTHALKIVSTQAPGVLTRWMSRACVYPADILNASVFLRTQGVTNGRARLAVTYWQGSTYAGRTLDSAVSLTGKQDWTKVIVLGRPPAGATCARVEFRLFGPGTLWIDDLAVERAFGVP